MTDSIAFFTGLYSITDLTSENIPMERFETSVLIEKYFSEIKNIFSTCSFTHQRPPLVNALTNLACIYLAGSN